MQKLNYYPILAFMGHDLQPGNILKPFAGLVFKPPAKGYKIPPKIFSRVKRPESGLISLGRFKVFFPKKHDDVTQEISLPSTRPLLDYQISAARYLTSSRLNNLGGCLFMEMRLGKTLTLIRSLGNLATVENPFLIIAPFSAQGAWKKEFYYEGIQDVEFLTGTKEERKKILIESRKKFYVVNSQMAQKLDLHLYDWDSLIVDESVSLANPKRDSVNGFSNYIVNNFKHIPFSYSLSGLPNPEGPQQYFQQCILPRKTVMGKINYKQWFFSNFDKNPLTGKYLIKSESQDQLLVWLHNNTFQLRRSDVNVGSKTVFQVLNVEIGKYHKKLYLMMLKNWSVLNERTNQTVSVSLQISHINELRKILGGVIGNDRIESIQLNKLIEIDKLLKTDLRNDNIIIWCNYTEEVNIIYERYKNLFNHKISMITGEDTTPSQRETIRLEFQAGIKKIVVSTWKALAKGGDWSRASTMIVYSNTFSYDDRRQALDRFVSPMDKDIKLVIDLIYNNSIEEDIHELLNSKIGNSDLFFTNLFYRLKKKGQV